MTLGTVLLVSLLFVLLNAVYVAAEFALIALPKPTVERSAAKGDRQARRLFRVLSSANLQDRYVATAQLGITLASLGLGMYGEHGLAEILEHRLGELPAAGRAAIASSLALAILTVLHIVIGEMLPKGLALQNPSRVARAAHWPMQITLVALYPLVAVSNGLARACLRLVGINRQQNAHEQVYTAERFGRSPARLCANSLSSETERLDRSWCRGCGWLVSQWGLLPTRFARRSSSTDAHGIRFMKTISITSSACCTPRICFGISSRTSQSRLPMSDASRWFR
jgi:Mg2+/Co2+ transporter CorB